MLTELYISNFAIIDQMEIQFKPGLSVFTGETGAGKSIIIDALETILGNRADTTFIRSGADRANIEATFHITENIQEPVYKLLEGEDLLDDPGLVTLGRELRRTGRSVARINGRSVNVSLLHEIGEFLVDIHGQSQHLSLLRVRQHLRLLDRYAETSSLVISYQRTYKEWQDTVSELDILQKNKREAVRRADLLTYQINEIDSDLHNVICRAEECRKDAERGIKFNHTCEGDLSWTKQDKINSLFEYLEDAKNDIDRLKDDVKVIMDFIPDFMRHLYIPNPKDQR